MRWTILLTAALTGCFLVPVETECTPQSVLDAIQSKAPCAPGGTLDGD